MSNQKFKAENYQNIGGINLKSSVYLTGPMEFLYLENVDFQTPGALTQRWGSTMYLGQTFATKPTSISEYSKLSGFSQIIVGTTSGIWAGATTGVMEGMSFALLAGPFGFSGGQSPYKVTPNSDASGNTPTISADNFLYQGLMTQRVTFNALSYSTSIVSFKYMTEVVASNYSSIAYLVDNCFIADGKKFVKYNGTTCTPIGLPMVIGSTITAKQVTALNASLIGWGGTFITQALFYCSYVNNRGFEGRISPMVEAYGGKYGAGPTNTLNYMQMTLGVFTPLELGISSINLYGYIAPETWTLVSGVSVLLSAMGLTAAWSYPYMYLGNYPASGSTISYLPVGSTAGGISALVNSNFPLATQAANQYVPLGESFVYFGNSTDNTIYPYTDNSYYPRYLTTYQNRLFCAGFSATPSTVWFSDVTEPEGFQLQNNFEVRTNDSDVITSMVSYQTRMYIFKNRSFHSLFGDNPNNFYLQEVSNIYGCLNNRCALVFQNSLIFLDRKGLIEFNGSQVEILSTKVQSIFDNMNYAAAVTNACMVHDKLRNQILIAIPSNSYALDADNNNNLVVVYDYIAGAWTTHRGYSPTIFAPIQDSHNTKNVFYGNSSGMICWQGASFLTDNGVGFTQMIKTRFLHEIGDSVQKQYRRLYVNSNFTGTTIVYQSDFLQDYGASVVYSATMYLTGFQNRIDFGISCKSLAFILYGINNSNSPMVMYGFSLESRLQRRV